MWTALQIVFFVLGLLFAFAGKWLSAQPLFYISAICFGLTSIAIGWEAILTRQIRVGRRRSGNRETYTGIPAVLHGVQFNLLGFFLIAVPLIVELNSGRSMVLQFVRRPGLPLIVFGTLLVMQAVITLVGSHELRQGPNWIVTMNLIVSRLLPGLILLVLGIGALGLGLFEIFAPDRFDEMGGGFLEVLYGIR